MNWLSFVDKVTAMLIAVILMSMIMSQVEEYGIDVFSASLSLNMTSFTFLILPAFAVCMKQMPKATKMPGKSSASADKKGRKANEVNQSSDVGGPNPDACSSKSPKKPKNEAKKRDPNVSLDVYVQTYCNHGNCVVEGWNDDVVFQVQMMSKNLRPDILWRIGETDGFLQFCIEEKDRLKQVAEDAGNEEDALEAYNEFPTTSNDLENAGVILRKGGSYDPSDAGFQEWRKVLYCGGGDGGLLFGMHLLLKYIIWKGKTDEFRNYKVNVNIFNATGVDLAAFQVVDGNVTSVFSTDLSSMPHLLDAVPPVGWQVVQVLVTHVNKETAQLSWKGPTYRFRELISEVSEIEGDYYMQDGSLAERGTGTYWLVWKNVKADDFDRLSEIMNTDVFGGFPFVVLQAKNIVPESCGNSCFDVLKALKQGRSS